MLIPQEFRSPAVLKGAVRSAVAFSVCMAVPLLLHWEDPFWCIWPAIFLTTPYLGFSIEKGILRVLGVLVGAAAGLALLDLYAQNWGLFTLALAVFVLVVGYFSAGPNYSYAFSVSGITASIIAAPGLLDPENAMYVAIFRAQNTAIGSLLALLVFSLLWPRRAGDEVFARIRVVTGQAALMLRDCQQALETGKGIDISYRDTRRKAIAGIAEYRSLVYYAVRDTGSVRRYREIYEQMGVVLRNLLMNCTNIANSLSLHKETPLPDELRQPTLSYLACVQQEIEAYGRDHKSPGRKRRRRLLQKHRALKTAWFSYLGAKGSYRYSPKKATLLGGMMDSILNTARNIQHCWDCTDAVQQRRRQTQVLPLHAAKSRRLNLRTSIQTYQLRKALQAAFAVILGMLVYYYADPPGGNTVFEIAAVYGCMAATLPLVTMRSMLSGTLVGCLIGSLALYGIFMHIDTSLAWLLIVLLPLTFIGGLFINTKQHSLFGKSYNLALAIVLIGGNKPIFDGVSWYTVIFGFALGQTFAVLATRLVWPFMPRVEYSRAVSQFFERASHLMVFWRMRRPERDEYEQLLIQTDKKLSAPLTDAWLWQGLGNWKFGVSKKQTSDLLLNIEGFFLRYRALEYARFEKLSQRTFGPVQNEILQVRDAMSETCARFSTCLRNGQNLPANSQLKEQLDLLDDKLVHVRKALPELVPDITPRERHQYLSLIDRYRECLEILDIIQQQLHEIDLSRLARPSYT